MTIRILAKEFDGKISIARHLIPLMKKHLNKSVRAKDCKGVYLVHSHFVDNDQFECIFTVDSQSLTVLPSFLAWQNVGEKAGYFKTVAY